MKNYKILSISLFIYIIFSILGAFFKIKQAGFATSLLIIGLLAYLVFIGLALKEILGSNSISASEKAMWFTGFLLVMVPLCAVIYLFSARRRILEPRYNFRARNLDSNF